MPSNGPDGLPNHIMCRCMTIQIKTDTGWEKVGRASVRPPISMDEQIDFGLDLERIEGGINDDSCVTDNI